MLAVLHLCGLSNKWTIRPCERWNGRHNLFQRERGSELQHRFEL